MGYLQFGRHSVKQIIRFKDAVNESVVVNPLLYASQGLRYNRKLQVILTTVIIYLRVLNSGGNVDNRSQMRPHCVVNFDTVQNCG
jgi:hypothetical protein